MAEREYDVFISHASEDKQAFVAPLANALSDLGVRVWYDEYTLKPGDSLSRSIDRGLSSSRYGLVVLSPSFIGKSWPDYELRGLVSQELEEKKVIIPVWFGVTKRQVLDFSPPLADKFAIDATGRSPAFVAAKVCEVVRPDIFNHLLRLLRWQQLRENAPVFTEKITNIRMGEIRHPALPQNVLVRIKLLNRAFEDVLPIPLDEQIDSFQRDANPWEELAIWEKMAAAYLEVLGKQDLSLDIRKEIVDALLACSMGMIGEESLERYPLLGRSGVADVMAAYLNVVPEIPHPPESGASDQERR